MFLIAHAWGCAIELENNDFARLPLSVGPGDRFFSADCLIIITGCRLKFSLEHWNIFLEKNNWIIGMLGRIFGFETEYLE